MRLAPLPDRSRRPQAFIWCNSASESVACWRAGEDAQQLIRAGAGDVLGVAVAMRECKSMSAYSRRASMIRRQVWAAARSMIVGWTLPCEIHDVPSRYPTLTTVQTSA